jgi:hypothetical protein
VKRASVGDAAVLRCILLARHSGETFTTAELVKPESNAFALLLLLVIPAKAGIQCPFFNL